MALLHDLAVAGELRARATRDAKPCRKASQEAIEAVLAASQRSQTTLVAAARACSKDLDLTKLQRYDLQRAHNEQSESTQTMAEVLAAWHEAWRAALANLRA